MSIRKLLLFFVLVALVAAMSLPTVFAGNDSDLAPLHGADSPNAISGQYIVVLKDLNAATSGAAPQEIADENGRVTHTYQAALNGFSAELTQDGLAKLREHPAVDYIEADQLMQVDGSQASRPVNSESGLVIEDHIIFRNAFGTGNSSPTSSFANTWPLDRINQRNLPLNGNSTQIGDGTGVHVYVIDSGITSFHQEFTGRVGAGHNTVGPNPGAWGDCVGTGTAVAGAIGGTTYGVAPDVTLHAVRVVDCNWDMAASDIIEGFDWVAANHVKPAVASFALIAEHGYSAVDAAVTGAMDAGVTVVVGAGNWVEQCEFNNYGNIVGQSPARMDRPLTVAAVNENDTPSFITGQGPCVDLFAPGGETIEMAWKGSPTAAIRNMWPGLATGYTAGTAALALEKSPLDTHDMVRATIINAATRGAVTGGGLSGYIKCSVNMMLYSGLEPSGLPVPAIDPLTCIDVCAFTEVVEPQTELWSGGALDSLYALRDDVFAGTELGEHYTELYYAHTGRVTELLIEESELRKQLIELMLAVLPGVNDMLNGDREAAKVTPQIVTQAQNFLRAISEADRGGELTRVIEREMEQVPWERLSGLTFSEAWEAMQEFN